MTRVYQSPNEAVGLRVLAVGAGSYPHAQAATATLPKLDDLTSVPPSIIGFLKKLLLDWRDDLALPLVSVDLLLSDPKAAKPKWTGFGLAGEVAAGTDLDPPTRTNLEDALMDLLQDATAQDGLLLLFCGHGFSRDDRYFVLSDFGKGPNPWNRCVNLDGLKAGLSKEPPRTQWLFWDCCATIPEEILDVLGDIGDPVVAATASEVSAAIKQYGDLSRFGVASAPIALEAFGIPDGASRFTEMLIEAIEGAGATKRHGGQWWVDDRGIMDALQTYVRRHPELTDPDFYNFVTPFSSDAPQRVRLRRLGAAPTSLLIAAAAPQRTALKTATVTVMPDAGGAALPIPPAPREQSMIHLPVPALHHYTVTAVFDGGNGPAVPQSISCFADLPLADSAEFQSP